MGLLNQILGGLAGSVLGRSALGGRLGGGKSRLMMLLLPVVLSMLTKRQRARGGRSPFSGLVAGGLAGGGLAGLLSLLSQKGYGQQAGSWVSTGPNQALPPEALSDVLGEQQLADIAAQAGVSEDEARTGLAELLPEVVDHFTPEGRIPEDNDLSASVDDYVKRLPTDRP